MAHTFVIQYSHRDEYGPLDPTVFVGTFETPRLLMDALSEMCSEDRNYGVGLTIQRFPSEQGIVKLDISKDELVIVVYHNGLECYKNSGIEWEEEDEKTAKRRFEKKNGSLRKYPHPVVTWDRKNRGLQVSKFKDACHKLFS